MRIVQIKFLKTYNVIITGLLALLGFASSCEKVNYDPKVEYGTPYAKFIVNGKIESGDSNIPIGNIRVVMQRDTTRADNEGKYQLVEGFEFPTDQIFNIKFQDIDGVANGEYEDLDTVVEFKDPEFIDGDGHWYRGETTQELNVKLNPKK